MDFHEDIVRLKLRDRRLRQGEVMEAIGLREAVLACRRRDWHRWLAAESGDKVGDWMIVE